MQGPDTCYDGVESSFGETNDIHFRFSGESEIPYEEFLRRIRQIAFAKGKGRDSAWMADLLSLHLSGNASKWFESLDEKTQQDWHLLRRAFLNKYGDANPEAVTAGESIYRENSTLSSPPSSTSVIDTSTYDPLLPARILIDTWSSPVPSSTIRFPKSKDEWLHEARQRRSKFSDKPGTVYWHLVEPSQWPPENLLPISLESGVIMYSIRAWQEGDLTLGKLAITGMSSPTKRAFISWDGKEVPWNGPFEVLVGDKSAVRWVTPQSAGKFMAVEGGFQVKHDAALFVALCNVTECTQPGKVFSSELKAYYGWWGKEHAEQNFCVLAWA